MPSALDPIVLLLSADGVVVHVNAAGRQLLGARAEWPDRLDRWFREANGGAAALTREATRVGAVTLRTTEPTEDEPVEWRVAPAASGLVVAVGAPCASSAMRAPRMMPTRFPMCVIDRAGMHVVHQNEPALRALGNLLGRPLDGVLARKDQLSFAMTMVDVETWSGPWSTTSGARFEVATVASIFEGRPSLSLLFAVIDRR